MRVSYVSSALGLILKNIALVTLIPVIVALFYKDFNSVLPFVTASGVAFLVSLLLRKPNDKLENLNDILKSEALCVVLFAWILFAFVAAIPFLFYGMSPINALFEATSSVTTTGATILTDFSLYPKVIFFWRSFGQWLGGMGIIVLFIAVLPQFAVAGRQMFFAEAPGPTEEKFTPRIKSTASALWLIYLALTVLEIILLKIAGMPMFDCVCNSFATISAGGLSPHPLSIAGYNSSLINWIIIVFMFLAGVNFTLQYRVVIQKKFKSLISDEEFRFYVLIIAFIACFIAGILLFHHFAHPLKIFTDSIFQVISIITTTGFVSVNYELWPIFAKMFLFILMFVGASASSASGGLKVIRFLFIFKYLKRELAKILHPNAILPIKVNHKPVQDEVVRQIMAFVIFYYAIFAISSFVVIAIEKNITLGLTGSMSTLGNVGPAFSLLGPYDNFAFLNPVTKCIFIFNMIIGRLELVPFLAMLHPDFWNIRK